MAVKTLALALPLALSLAACGSTPTVQLSVSSEPAGATVTLSRVGERSYRADLGPVEGDVRSEAFTEDAFVLGTAPLTYESPLEEEESSAKVLGFGGGVVREYHEGVLRFEKEGFETIERRVRFRDGKVEVHARLDEDADDPQL